VFLVFVRISCKAVAGPNTLARNDRLHVAELFESALFFFAAADG
jgi:hypothetical protein